MRENSQAESKRELPDFRDHDTYDSDHWTVVDISKVDKVFAIPTSEKWGEDFRVDIDGHVAESHFSDESAEGDNVNTSIWLPMDKAKELQEQLGTLIDKAEHE